MSAASHHGRSDLLTIPWRCLRDACAVANIVVLLVGLLLVWCVVSFVRRHRRGIVAERGTSVGADLGALGDQPRVRVRAVTTAAPDRVHIVLTPDTGADGRGLAPPDLGFLVALRQDEFGFELLHEWARTEQSVAIVLPPGSRIMRLRAIDDLQPLTLRCVDEE
jgi:hypothetical protein